MTLIVNGAPIGGLLPDVPHDVLLDVSRASRVVVLNADGEGDTESYDTAWINGVTAVLGGEAAGTTIVADGAGDVTGTSAAVSAMLAAANASAIRTAAGVQDGPRYIPLAGGVTVDATMGTRVIGGSPEAIDASAHAITGRTQTWTLLVSASVTSGQTGTIELYDLVAVAVAATITVTSTDAGTAHTASITLPGTARRYELRASCTGATAAHYVAILATALKQSWS